MMCFELDLVIEGDGTVLTNVSLYGKQTDN